MSQQQILILNQKKLIFDILTRSDKKRTILMVSHDLHTIINEVKKVITVQGYVNELHPKEVCEHFSLGLYHKPLIGKEK